MKFFKLFKLIKNKKYAKINLVYFFSKKIIVKQQEIKTLLENNNFRNNQNYIFWWKLKKKIIEKKKITFFYIIYSKYSNIFRVGFFYCLLFSMIYLLWLYIDFFTNNSLYIYFLILIIYLFFLLKITIYKVSLNKNALIYRENIDKYKILNIIKQIPKSFFKRTLYFLKQRFYNFLEWIFLEFNKLWKSEVKSGWWDFIWVFTILILVVFSPFVFIFLLSENKGEQIKKVLYIILVFFIIWKIILFFEKIFIKLLIKKKNNKFIVKSFLNLEKNNTKKYFYLEIKN